MKLQSAASVLALLSPLALASSAWKTDPSQKKNQSHDIAPRHTTTSSELESIGNILAVPIEDYSEGSSKSTRRDLSRFTIPSYSWTQLGNDIESTIQQANDFFGYFVSISADGRTVAASAFNCDGYDDQAHVEVHTYDADTDQWVKLGQSIPTVPGASDDFGYSISLSPDGTTLAIGARDSNDAGNRQGRLTVYRYDAGLASWEVMGNVIYGEAEFDRFGESVSLSQNGEILAVGAKYNGGNGDYSGHVRIYRFNYDAWEKIGDDIDGENPGDQAGSSVSLSFDGQTVAVGAKDNNDGFGHVRVFGLDANDNWVQIGQDIDGDTSNYYAGDRYVSLAGEGHTVAFSSVKNGGLIQIYRLNSSSNQWEKLGNDIPGGANQAVGYALQLSADGNTLAVGHSYYDNQTGYTEMYRYDQTRNIWKPMGLTIDGEQDGEYSGWTVSLAADGKTVVVGETEHQVNGLADAGRLRVFELNEVSYFCGSNMEEFRGHRIYFRGEDPRDSVQKCFMIEAVDGGLFAANNNDKACKNVHEYEVTEEISNVRMIKNGKVEMEATSQFSEWNGKVFLREKPNKKSGSMRPRFEFDWGNMEFKIVLKVSSCPVVS